MCTYKSQKWQPNVLNFFLTYVQKYEMVNFATDK